MAVEYNVLYKKTKEDGTIVELLVYTIGREITVKAIIKNNKISIDIIDGEDLTVDKDIVKDILTQVNEVIISLI